MKTASLEILEKSELSPAQAHAILKVMELETASSAEIPSTKADIAALRAELLGALRAVEGRIEGTEGRVEGKLSRWVLTCVLGQTAVLLGAGYFFLAQFRR